MITEAPKVKPTGRYSATQTAGLLGIHRNTLRRWTEAGTIRCKMRKSTSRAFYTGSEILRVYNETY